MKAMGIVRRAFLVAFVLMGFTVSSWAAPVPAPWADVRAFGATGDGHSDDTAAFQRALDTGMPVLIAPSQSPYIVSKTLYVGDGQTVMGFGGPTATVKFTGTGPCFATSNKQQRKFTGVNYHDFVLSGTGNQNADGILVARTNYANIQNMRIENIGGIGIVIDGTKAHDAAQAHYAYLANVRVYGVHQIGLQLRGPGANEGTNRHRVFFLKDDGARDVGLDIMSQSNTSQFYGLAFENVHGAIRIAGRNNTFYGLNIETVHGNGVEFLQGAVGNRFFGVTAAKIDGSPWLNEAFNKPGKSLDRGTFQNDSDQP